MTWQPKTSEELYLARQEAAQEQREELARRRCNGNIEVIRRLLPKIVTEIVRQGYPNKKGVHCWLTNPENGKFAAWKVADYWDDGFHYYVYVLADGRLFKEGPFMGPATELPLQSDARMQFHFEQIAKQLPGTLQNLKPKVEPVARSQRRRGRR